VKHNAETMPTARYRLLVALKRAGFRVADVRSDVVSSPGSL